MTRTRSLFKYFTEQRWADAFLEGKILFRSLAYFRDYEDTKVRGDRNEGISIYRPEGGLLINNHTQGKSFTIPDAAFEVVTNQEEIFVYCLSRSLTDGLRERFESVACVEILKPPNFCERIKKALQAEAIFVAGRVEYYCQNDPPNPHGRYLTESPCPRRKATDGKTSFDFRSQSRTRLDLKRVRIG